MKAFRIQSLDQYIQNVRLNRGTYTFSAWIFTYSANYSFGLQTGSGVWLSFSVSEQLKSLGNWNRVKLTFTIYEPCVKFSLMHSGSTFNVYAAAPMLEEGTNAGTHKPNELDLDESIGDGAYTILLSNESHTFAGSTSTALLGSTTTDVLVYKAGEKILPTSITINQGDLPTGMTTSVNLSAGRVTVSVTTSMTSPAGLIPITFVVDGKTFTLQFSYAISFKGSDGITGEDAPLISLAGATQIISISKTGAVTPSSNFTVVGTAINTTISVWQYSVNGGTFSSTLPTGVTRSGSTVTVNPNTSTFKTLSIRAGNGTISDTFTIARVADGYDGIDGNDGADGDSAVTIILSNESHIFAGSATAALAGSTNTAILAFKGTQQITPTSVTVNTSDLPTGMSRTVNGSVITFTVTTSMTSSSGVIPITVVIDGKTFTIQFSYAIAFKGADGIDGIDGNDGAPGLSKGIYLNAATQVIKYNAAGTPTPSSNFTVVGTAVNTTISTWQYSVNGGTFSSTLPAGVGRSGNTVTISPTTVTFNTLSIRASDGTISDTTTIAALRDGNNGLPGKLPIQIEWVQGDTHLNNDAVIHYIYYRSGNTWWRLKDAYTERVATASPSTTYYQQLSSVEMMVTKILIAEEANLAGMIFKSGRLISQKGMINGVESIDYSNPAFVPYIHIDGNNGEMMANKLLNPFVIADPLIAGDLQSKLTGNHNIYLAPIEAVTDYRWIEHLLPGNGTLADKSLDGLNIKIYATQGSSRRILLKPAHQNGIIFLDGWGGVGALKLVPTVRDRIHLSAVWNRTAEVLDWVVTSRNSHTLSSGRVLPAVFKEGDVIFKGVVSAAGVLSSVENRMRVEQHACSVTSNRYTLSLYIHNSYNANSVAGDLIPRNITTELFDIDICPREMGTTSAYSVFKNKYIGQANGISYGIHFVIQFRNLSNTVSTSGFSFVVRAAGNVFNNSFLDDTL